MFYNQTSAVTLAIDISKFLWLLHFMIKYRAEKKRKAFVVYHLWIEFRVLIEVSILELTVSFFTLSLCLLRFTFPVFILFVHFALYFAGGSNEKLKKESKTGMCCYTYSLISLFHFTHSLFKLMMLTFTQFLKLLRRPWGPTITRNFVPILFTFEKES